MNVEFGNKPNQLWHIGNTKIPFRHSTYYFAGNFIYTLFKISQRNIFHSSANGIRMPG